MSMSIPEKLYYKIGEVAHMAGVRTSVLRFWETEFEFLSPEKSTTGQRLYSKKEIDLVLLVRRLLYEEKFTIEGVKKKISSKGKNLSEAGLVQKGQPVQDFQSLLHEIRNDLCNLRNIL